MESENLIDSWALFRFKNKKRKERILQNYLLNYSELQICMTRKNRDRNKSHTLKKKKKKNRQNSKSLNQKPKNFFSTKTCEYQDREIQLFVFHCSKTKVSPNVFNKRFSGREPRYLGPRPWPAAHYAGRLHSHDFEQVLTTIGKLGGRGPFTDGARKCAKKLIELAGFPRHRDTMGALSAPRRPPPRGVLLWGAGNGGRRGLATRDGKWARNIHGPRHEIGGRAANNSPPLISPWDESRGCC